MAEMRPKKKRKIVREEKSMKATETTYIILNILTPNASLQSR